MQSHSTLTDEFTDSVKNFIEMVNLGQVNERLRGAKRTKAVSHLLLARQKVVEVVKQHGLRCRDKFRAISVVRYKEMHGTDPVEDGMLVRTIEVPGHSEKVECVLVRKAPVGEWDLELDVSTATVLRETHDAGKLNVREKQQEAKLQKLAQTLGQTVKGAMSMEAMHDIKEKKKLEDAEAAAAGQEGGKGKDIASDSGAEDDDANGLADSLLGDLLPKQPTRALAKAAPGTGRVANTKAKPPVAASSQPPEQATPLKKAKREASPRAASSGKPKKLRGSPRQPDDEDLSDTGTGSKGRGKGKGALIPLDPVELLEQEGLNAIEETLNQFAEELQQGPFSTNLTHHSEKQDFNKACLTLISKVDKESRRITQIFARLNRRKRTPQEAYDKLEQTRAMIKALVCVLKGSAGAANCEQGLQELDKNFNVKLGRAFYIKYHKEACGEIARFGKFEELARRLKVDADHLCDQAAPEVIKEVNAEIVESVLQRVVKSGTGTEAQDATVLARLQAAVALLASEKILAQDALSDLQKLDRLLGNQPDAEDGEDVDCMKALEDWKGDQSYNGICRAMLMSTHFVHMMKVLQARVTKGPGRAVKAALAHVTKGLNNIRDSSRSWSDADKLSLRKGALAVISNLDLKSKSSEADSDQFSSFLEIVNHLETYIIDATFAVSDVVDKLCSDLASTSQLADVDFARRVLSDLEATLARAASVDFSDISPAADASPACARLHEIFSRMKKAVRDMELNKKVAELLFNIALTFYGEGESPDRLKKVMNLFAELASIGCTSESKFESLPAAFEKNLEAFSDHFKAQDVAGPLLESRLEVVKAIPNPPGTRVYNARPKTLRPLARKASSFRPSCLTQRP